MKIKMNISIIFLFILFSLHNMRGQAKKLTNRKSDEQKCKRESQVFIGEKLRIYTSEWENLPS